MDAGKLALWRGRFERFSRGDLAVEAFCARERVSVACFYYWRKKVGVFGRVTQGRRPMDRAGAFQPVTVVPLDTMRTHSRSVAAKPCVASRLSAVPAVRIELPCGTRIELASQDLEVVRTVVGMLVRSDDGHEGRAGAC
jgi:hypothetical protein